MNYDTEYEVRYLKNGLRIIFFPNKKIEHIYLRYNICGGFAYEDYDKELHLSHFFEHIMGDFVSNKYKTGHKILDKLGCSYNAFTSLKFIEFHIKTLEVNFDKVLDIMVESYRDPIINDTMIKRESRAMIEESNATINDTDYEFIYEGTKLMYGDKTYLSMNEYDVINSIKSTTKLMLKNFRKKFFSSDNTTFIFAGNVDIEKIMSYLETKLGKLRPRNEKIIPYIVRYKLRKNTCFFKRNDSYNNNGLMIIFRTDNYKYTDKIESVNILGKILNMVFFNLLREKLKLIYSINCYYSHSTNEINEFIISTETSYVDKVVFNIMKELKRLIKIGINKKIFYGALNNVKMHISEFYTENKRMTNYIEKYSEQIIDGRKVRGFNDSICEIKNLNVKKVNDVMKEIFNFNKVFIGYTGNKKEPKLRSVLKDFRFIEIE